MQVVQIYPMENYDVAVYFADGTYDSYNCLDTDPLMIYQNGLAIPDSLKELA